MGNLKFDKESLRYVEDKNPIGVTVLHILKFAGYTLGLVLIYYLIYSLVFSTEDERHMAYDTRLISDEYEALSKQVDLLEGAVADLSVKDRNIYAELFNSSYSRFGVADSALVYDESTVYSEDVMLWEKSRLNVLERSIENVESLINELNAETGTIAEKGSKIPSILPVANFPLGNIGASVGRKIHPFYKELVFHDGLDLVVPSGVEVIATADGVVKSVARAKKLEGNRVEIEHEYGYTTVFAHLSDILVRNGQKVKKGTVIGRVGNSGTSFAPHLHYKVLLDGKVLDPLCFVNGELDPQSYEQLLIHALNSGQSLD